MNNFSLSGKTVLVAGASSGIGYGVALKCADAGASLILFGRDKSRLDQCRAACLAAGAPQCYMSSVNLADENELCKTTITAVEQVGRVSGLVYSAGIADSRPIKISEFSDMLNDYRINVVAGLRLAGLLSQKKYADSNGSSFVFLSSVTAHVGTAGKCSYTATKGALLSAVRSLAAELAGRKIRVNSVSPGYIAGTGITRKDFDNLPQEAQNRIVEAHPLGLGMVDAVALPIVFLLSDASYWITGTDLCIDGGYRLRK